MSDDEQDPNLKERFDFDEMMILVDDDLEMATMMMSNFIETEPATLENIIAQANLDAEMIDWEVLRKDAHSMKGSSSYLCAKQVSSLALELQHAAEAQSKEEIDKLTPLLIQEFDLAVSYMEAKLQDLSC